MVLARFYRKSHSMSAKLKVQRAGDVLMFMEYKNRYFASYFGGLHVESNGLRCCFMKNCRYSIMITSSIVNVAILRSLFLFFFRKYKSYPSVFLTGWSADDLLWSITYGIDTLASDTLFYQVGLNSLRSLLG